MERFCRRHSYESEKLRELQYTLNRYSTDCCILYWIEQQQQQQQQQQQPQPESRIHNLNLVLSSLSASLQPSVNFLKNAINKY